MPNFISEDDIEQAMLQKLKHLYGYDVLDCFTENRDDLDDMSGRTSKREVILPAHLKTALTKLNPEIPAAQIDEACRTLSDRRQTLSPIAANRELEGLIRDGVPVSFRDSTGKQREERVTVIDFKDETENDFLAVSQLWIQGEQRYRRPDVLLYVNGLPLVFIELKNSNVKLKSAYDDNLTNYKADIPQLFLTNAFCVFSNALETRIGSMTAGWEHYFQWLRPEDEKEKINRKQITNDGTSAERFLAGLCPKATLLDYIEKFLRREEFKGKLGVFWHTQGSGKSFSMIFYSRKIIRKCVGNYSFVVITDREDLDSQIYRNFLSTGAVKKSDAAQPKDSEEMHKFLGQNKRLVFTLIHKFGWAKGKKYPVLSERDDIIVIVDEAHRTQYKSLAENMRAGLPNANYLAFTGTPLLGRDRKTDKWFGGYVSEYNFSQSMDDGATVPLFYSKRVPTMLNQNTDLSDEFYEILEDEDLNPLQQEKLEKKYANTLEVIKRDDRLETVAADIVEHFPRRGYLGKGLVVSLDKPTAVKMYDKVQRRWKDAIKALRGEIKKAGTSERSVRLKRQLDYMRRVEMAVIVSEEAGENERFDKLGLDIRKHRKALMSLDENGHDLEYKFKEPSDPLQLVFVCAMWLTGFDAPTLSTLYLDKPQKDHTLMQTIARANRVTSWKINGVEKKNGEIIDYLNFTKSMRKALKDYGEGNEGSDEPPVKDKDALFALLNDSIREGKDFCLTHEINMSKALLSKDVFSNLSLFEEWANILLGNDDWRKSFNVYENTITALYEASKPEILGKPVVRTVAMFQYLRGVLDSCVDEANIDNINGRISDLLDESVVTDKTGDIEGKEAPGNAYKIQRRSKVWDLSKIDFEQLRAGFKKTAYKNIEITDLRAFLEKKIAAMLEQNSSRQNFAERLQEIINEYNAGSSSVDNTYDDLMAYAENLKKEAERATREGLTEDELELFDLIKKKKMTAVETTQVKLAAKSLLEALLAASPKVLVQDWFKDTGTQLKVRDCIEEVLHDCLPEESYDRALFMQNRDSIFDRVLTHATNHSKWAA